MANDLQNKTKTEYVLGCFGIYDQERKLEKATSMIPSKYVLNLAGFFVKEKNKDISEARHKFAIIDEKGMMRFDQLLEEICAEYDLDATDPSLEYAPKTPSENKKIFSDAKQIWIYSKMPVANLERAIYINI
jgi:hypothetical protein